MRSTSAHHPYRKYVAMLPSFGGSACLAGLRRAGDVALVHPLLLHSSCPNAMSDAPRYLAIAHMPLVTPLCHTPLPTTAPKEARLAARALQPPL